VSTDKPAVPEFPGYGKNYTPALTRPDRKEYDGSSTIYDENSKRGGIMPQTGKTFIKRYLNV
jgi:hypothetical protein